MHREPFPLKARYIILVWLIPFFYMPGIDFIYGLMGDFQPWYWYEVVFVYYYFSLVLGLMLLLVFVNDVNWRSMLGWANKEEYLPALKLTTFVFLFSIAATYAVFYPLSFVFPEFVEFWLIDLPPIVYYTQDGFPLIANLLSFVVIVILGPVIEEFAFRGFLLHRWSDKWGVTRAVIFSSALFGVLHPDILGAMVFGVAMSILYLKTQTLLVPIVCHAANNMLAWLIEFGYAWDLGPEYVFSLQDFREEWMWGAVSGLLVIVWIVHYLKARKNQNVWRLPN